MYFIGLDLAMFQSCRKAELLQRQILYNMIIAKPGVNFTNILHTAFAHKVPKNAKRH
jgi:hypothetical protein